MSRSTPAATRRWQASFITAVFILAIAGAALAGWWYARESAPHQGPIVLISADGLRPDPGPAQRPFDGDAGTATDGPTPAIDALVADAVVFERAYTHSPLTLPAHASLLAGQLPFEHGVRDEAGFALKDSARPLAELLQSRGFETGAAVSSFLLRPESGMAQGFSFFDAELPDEPDVDSPVVERDGAQTTEAAVQWLRSRRGYRFLLFVQVNSGTAESTVAELVSTLKDLGLYGQATIILTSDRGETGSGVALDERALHVPLLVKQPGSEGAGQRVAVPVQHIDILPTILDLVRAPIPSGLRGRSLRAVLGGDETRVAPQSIYAESLAERFRFGAPGAFALASPEYRYVRRADALVDPEDPPVAAPATETPAAGRLRVELDRLLDRYPVDPPAEIAAADADRYAALGYLGGPLLLGADSSPLDPDEEAAVVKAHHTAALLASRAQYTAAVDHLRGILRAHPRLAIVQYQLGALLSRAGRLEEAETAFRTLASMEPDNPYIPTALADVLSRSGRYDDARDRAALAVALAERSDARARAAAHEVAARVALALDDREQAQAHGEAAEREDPAVPMASFVRGRLLYADGQYEEALVPFEEAAAALAQRGRALEDLHWYKGDTLARLDRNGEAEMQFREEVRAFPRNIRAYASLATLYHATSRMSEAEEILEAIIGAAPTPEGYDTAARLWTTLGEPARAMALRADARARFRGDPSLARFERRR